MPYVKRITRIKFCTTCGKAFLPRPGTKPKNLFCSPPCALKSRKKRFVSMACRCCGKVFEVRFALRQTRRYCSKTCDALGRRNHSTDFWHRVDTSGGPEACWPFTGYRRPKGYGMLMWQGKHTLAHRLAYLLHTGELSDTALICHRCNNPSCCNPEHLYAGTPADNVHDRTLAGKHKTNLRRGEQNHQAKLTVEQVISIRQSHGMYSQRQLARMFHVARQTIRAILHNQIWCDLVEAVPYEQQSISKSAYKQRLAIAQRDHWICHLCGKTVDKQDMSIDHLIPTVAKGNDLPRNLALAHLQCNLKRNHNRLPAQLRLFG